MSTTTGGGGIPHTRHVTAVVHAILPQTVRPSLQVGGGGSVSPTPTMSPGLSHSRPHSTSTSHSHSHSHAAKARSGQVLVACAACQKRKSKCTGERPRCTLCGVKKTECVYETRFGEARSTQLKRRCAELAQENEHLRHALDTLRTVSSNQAGNLLGRIRETAGLDEAVRLILDSALLLSVRLEESPGGGGGANGNNGGETNGGGGESGASSVASSGSGSLADADRSEVMRIGNLVAMDMDEREEEKWGPNGKGRRESATVADQMLDPKLRGL